MKTVKKRTVSIIHELIGNEELMTLSELAEKFEVSQRTIRNDLKLINELLKEMDLGKIRLVGGRIICPSSFGQVLKAGPANGTEEQSLGKGEYYILADDPSSTEDSRSYGPILRKQIKGIVVTLIRRRNL